VEIRLASNMGPVGSERLCRASQFDPAIDKERIISSLRWNMSVLHQTVPNMWLDSRSIRLSTKESISSMSMNKNMLK
jgi:hypothetical protein